MTREELMQELRAEIRDERVLSAMASIPRERFVPPELRGCAWENGPLPIGAGQTISQPMVVARMCELLELAGDEVVLDVGTGSGYHAAVLSQLAARVVSIERRESLSEAAAANLEAAGIDDVELVVGDGSHGYAAGAPYDAINVAAASAEGVPPALEDQLAQDGRLVLPTDGGDGRLMLIRKVGDHTERERLDRVRFVPLVRDPIGDTDAAGRSSRHG